MFQFGIRSMLAVTLAAAGLFAAVFAVPPEIGIGILTYANRLLIPLFLAGVVYGRGYGRAFSIGGLTWYGLPMIFHEDLVQTYANTWVGVGGMQGIPPDRAPHLVRLLMAGVSGLLALSVRYVSLGRPAVAVPAPAAEPEGAKPPVAEEPRERLPYWLVPVASLLLLVGVMIGWLKIDSGEWSLTARPGSAANPYSIYSNPYATSSTMTVNGTVIATDGSIGLPPTDTTVAPDDPIDVPATK